MVLVVESIGLGEQVVLLLRANAVKPGVQILRDMEVVKADVGIREARPGKLHIELRTVATQVSDPAAFFMGEVAVEVFHQFPLCPVGDDVQKLARLAIGQVGDELDPLGLLIEFIFDLRKRLIEAEDFRKMVRDGRDEVFQDDVHIMCGYAVHPGDVVLGHDGMEIPSDAFGEWDCDVCVLIEPWDILHEGIPARLAQETLLFADDLARLALTLRYVTCVEHEQAVLFGVS